MAFSIVPSPPKLTNKDVSFGTSSWLEKVPKGGNNVLSDVSLNKPTASLKLFSIEAVPPTAFIASNIPTKALTVISEGK